MINVGILLKKTTSRYPKLTTRYSVQVFNLPQLIYYFDPSFDNNGLSNFYLCMNVRLCTCIEGTETNDIACNLEYLISNNTLVIQDRNFWSMNFRGTEEKVSIKFTFFHK